MPWPVLLKKNGGAEGVRTPDPHNAIVVLYQLSYDPIQSPSTLNDCRELSKKNARLPLHRMWTGLQKGFWLGTPNLKLYNLRAMNNELPLVSVLIPVHPHKTEVKSAAAARQFDYPREKLEIMVVRTTDLSIGPGIKRNAGLKTVCGELVYFLDDDSVAPSDNVNRAIKHFSDPMVKMVGGPNLCPPDAPLFERVLGLVMGSWLAFGPSRARYRAVGKLRAAVRRN